MKKLSLFLLQSLCLIIIYPSLQAQENSAMQPIGQIVGATTFTDKSHNFFLSNRFKQATTQRDSFVSIYIKTKNLWAKDSTRRNERIDSFKQELSDLSTAHKQLSKTCKKTTDDYNTISNKFTEFMEASTNNSDKMNIALEQKNKELEQKNKELEERENRLRELESITNKQDSISKALRALIQKALLNFNNKELTVELKNGKVYISFSDEFLFKSGSADVENKGLDALRKVAEVINENAKIDILIEGHTDNVPIKSGKFKDNWDLSAARSISVVRLLSNSYNVSSAKLTAAGRGEFANKASNETAEGKAKNRRIEIILSPDLSELYKMIYQ